MPSDRSKKAAAAKASKKADKLGLKTAPSSKSLREDGASPVDQVADALAGASLDEGNGNGNGDGNGAGASNGNGAAPKEKEVDSGRSVTGVWAAHPQARDIQVDSFTLLFHGHELLADARLELNFGRRYGLLGPNGCGKSCMLKAIAAREVPIPDHIDMFLVDREIPATDKCALAAVMEVDGEKTRLEAEAELLAERDMTPEVEARLSDVYERLDALDSDLAEVRAAQILHGLGFDKAMQAKKCREFSGGWRMRIALARALYLNPTFLLLDEPTNHLDLEACVWLEEYLKTFNRILIIISHSQDFLNGVCTNIIHMQKKALNYYSGNYDQFVQTRAELEENQMKKYRQEQDQIAGMKEYIARFGHGSAKLARQAQSKEKVLAKMVRGGLTERVEGDRTVKLSFTDVGKLPPPVLQFADVAFGYSRDKILYAGVDLGVDLDSRVAIVGPNGTGKSTLLNLMTGQLEPVDGMVKRHNHLRIGMYHQHLTDLLDPEVTPLDYMTREFPDAGGVEKVRSMIGRFGVTGPAQTLAIKHLSDGLKSRVVFSWLAQKTPHMLLLDEPTNHLDMETIDSLAEAINAWDGGMVLVSHDFRLIGQVAKEIWEVRGGKVSKWPGDILSYKRHLKKQHDALAKK